MDDPGLHLGGWDSLDFHAHRLASLSQRSHEGSKRWSAQHGAPRRRPARSAPSNGPSSYLPSHLLTFAWFAAIHFCAALSGFKWSPAMYFATSSWSVLVQLNRLSNAKAGEPLFANFALKTLLRTMWSYAHLYFATFPPGFASSWHLLNRFGSSTSESLYWRFRYCGVYQ